MHCQYLPKSAVSNLSGGLRKRDNWRQPGCSYMHNGRWAIETADPL